MANPRSLCDLPVSGVAVVQPWLAASPMGRRLLDIGFTGGAVVRCLFAAPPGEPRAYRIRGAVIALRKEDAAFIPVEECQLWD